MLYLIMAVSSAGMFHAATAFLPSTFAMYTTMLGMASFIDRRRGFRTVEGVFWFALGGLLGWPFSLAVCVPFIGEEFLVGVVSGIAPTIVRFIRGGLVSLALLVSVPPGATNGTYSPGCHCGDRLVRLPEACRGPTKHYPVQRVWRAW